MKIPRLVFVGHDHRIGVVENAVMHPDSGALFEADIRFTAEDGTTYLEGWRGPNMRGHFEVSDAYTPMGVFVEHEPYASQPTLDYPAGGPVGHEEPTADGSVIQDVVTGVLCTSHAEFRRYVYQGAVRVNGQTIHSPIFIVRTGDHIAIGRDKQMVVGGVRSAYEARDS